MERESIYRRYIPAVSPDEDNDDYAYWFVFCINRLLLNSDEGSIPYIKNLSELDTVPERTQYLGTLDGHPCYSAEVSPDTIAPEGLSFSELRPLYGVLDEDIYLLAGKAIQIVNWDRTHRYCGGCGHDTQTLQDERAKKCPVCGLLSFPRLSPATITAVLKDNEILLTRYASFRGNMHTLVAGFVEPGETLEECIKREVLEEAGIEIKNIRYFGSQPWPFPNSLMIGFTAEYESGEITVDGREIAEAGWYDVNNLPEVPPQWSIARQIIDWFVDSNSGKI
ncbi:NAD(+) diphosphatase [Chloroflexota bacterium]